MTQRSKSPTQFTSGDPTADRRADYARMFAESGDWPAAGELMQQALELAPQWAAGWFRFGEYTQKAALGDAGSATAAGAYRRVLELAPDDVFGAGLRLALLGEGDAPASPPSRFIEGLFDDYADRFDIALVEKLGYSVPAELAALVAPFSPFSTVVDLGCGTGLFGAAIRDSVTRLEGFDLSGNMLAKAQGKRIYDHLGQADLSLASVSSGLFGEGMPRHRADLVSAADVLMYLGSLDAVFPLVLELLSPQGIFAFSVEDAGQAEGCVLKDSFRYAHSEVYVRTLLSRHGLVPMEIENTVIRMEAGKPVPGILFLSRKAA